MKSLVSLEFQTLKQFRVHEKWTKETKPKFQVVAQATTISC